MNKDKMIEILLEKIELLEEENDLLHSQVDVIDVDMSDYEAESIINQMRANRSLDFEDECELHRLLTLSQELEQMANDVYLNKPVNLSIFNKKMEEFDNLCNHLDEAIQVWRNQILTMNQDINTAFEEGF